MKTINYILFISLSLFISCNTAREESNTVEQEAMQTGNMETNENTERPLETILNEKKTNFELNASDEKKETYAAGQQSVEEQQVVKNALQVGEIAPDFTLMNAMNEEISLYSSLENGSVILIWYRGGWCPYCNLTLHQMGLMLPEFQKEGAQLLALTPELPDSSFSTKEKNEIEFEVLSDIDNAVAREYNVVFKLTDDVQTLYENGFGLSDYNGNDKGELPLAATYIIGQDKVIKYAFLDADYRNRAEPIDILEALKNIK